MIAPYRKEASLQLADEADTLTIACAFCLTGHGQARFTKVLEAHELQADAQIARPWPIQSPSESYTT